MSHHIYNTKGVILNSRTQREADRVFSILTKDLGLVRATAQGVRKGNSKLGGILMKFSVVSVSLVKGRNMWRITTASQDEARERLTRNKLSSLARVAALLEKLIHGEEKHNHLFETVVSALEFLKDIPEKDAGLWEIVLVSRILYLLGYLSPNEAGEEYLKDKLSKELLDETSKNKRKLVSLINSGIRESGL